jgi:hypothetical protein
MTSRATTATPKLDFTDLSRQVRHTENIGTASPMSTLDQHISPNGGLGVFYIVKKLTPTEIVRSQGGGLAAVYPLRTRSIAV